MQALCTIPETARLIASGRQLFLAGDEMALRALPRGDWIGGTIPYFMAPEGGLCTREHVFVTEVPSCAQQVVVRAYDAGELSNIYDDASPNGLSFLVFPAGGEVHRAFAIGAPTYPGFGTRPLVGWVAGVHLSGLSTESPKVFLGVDGGVFTDRAVAIHVALPATKNAEIGILNLFEPGEGELITFFETGFKVGKAKIGGVERNLAHYIKERSLDVALPLVADYGGASVNVSVQSVDADRGEVTFFAPVFRGVHYRHAKPVGDYVAEFLRRVPGDIDRSLVFSCNCILNYMHSKLEGRRTGDLIGPVTFGEVAYQLLNQTLVYVTLSEACGHD